jgi:hypothetical protein
MSLPQCPVCHRNATLAGNTAYCPNCGWNRDAAISSIKASLNATPIGVLMFGIMAAFVYWGMKFNRAPFLMIFWCLPAAGLLFNHIHLKRTMTKLLATPAPSKPSSLPSNFDLVSGNAPTSAPTFSATAIDEALLRTPAPRRIRVSKGGRITVVVAALGLSLFTFPFAIGLYNQWKLHHSFAHVTGLGWGILLECIVVLAAYGIWRGQTAECDLLEHGEAVMGRVTRQWKDNKNSSWVDYEFTDFLGSSHQGGAMDRTSRLFAGMPLVVFYDRDNPKRQIAYCSTLHEVILPFVPAPTTDELLANR